jgi:hypothetical protein
LCEHRQRVAGLVDRCFVDVIAARQSWLTGRRLPCSSVEILVLPEQPASGLP